MNNNKGFTIIELLITLTFTLVIVYGVISVPTQLIKDYSEYQKLIQYTDDINKTRKALSMDLESTLVKALDENTLQIGNKLYRFDDDGLYRESKGNTVELNSEKLYYNITNSNGGKLLHIYNGKINLSYSINNSSFDLNSRGESNE